jgi:hypothetical protein
VIYRVQTKNPIPWGESSIRQSREADRFIAFVGADSQSQGRISLQVFFFLPPLLSSSQKFPEKSMLDSGNRWRAADCILSSPTNLHTHVHTYIHTYIHTYMNRVTRCFCEKKSPKM